MKENLSYYKATGGSNAIRLPLCLFPISSGRGSEEINFRNADMSVSNQNELNIFERCVIYYMNENMFGFIRYSVEKKIAGGGGGGVFYVWTKLNCKQLLGQSLKVINKLHIQQCQNSSKKK